MDAGDWFTLLWGLLLVYLFVILPLYFCIKEAKGQKKEGQNYQRQKDLEWWIAERDAADNPWYRHVCQDMVDYLSEGLPPEKSGGVRVEPQPKPPSGPGAASEHPSFKNGVRVVKPGLRQTILEIERTRQTLAEEEKVKAAKRRSIGL